MSAQSRTRQTPVSPTPFGLLLRRHRERAGLTQEELAERADLSADAVSALERGVRRRAQPKTMRALATALQLSGSERSAFLMLVSGPPSDDDEAVTAMAESPTRVNLPIPLTPLVGREREQAAALALLDQPSVRLLTLLGPGGVGKTRLGMAVAAAAAARFDITVFVDLAPLRDPVLVSSALAHAFGLPEQGGCDPMQRLATSIADRSSLLLVDNFEHLPAAAPVIAELLQRCHQLKLLVTSRAALRVRGEREFSVSPLAVPDKMAQDASGVSITELLGYPAVRLYVERTQALDPSFSLTAANAGAVAEICRRLDGLPLALELAAARSRVLPPLALLTQLSNRLALLVEGPIDAPVRQRTLRAAIGWSYDLLSADEQTLFRRLSVFVGGFALEAAEFIGGGETGLLDGVESLASKSLLRRASTADEERPRFLLLETVREYGLERLRASGEEAAIRDRHAAYFLAFTERAEQERIGPAQQSWLDRLTADHANLRAALEWLTERGELAEALRLAAACAWFWWFRGHYAEGRARLEALVGRPGADAHPRAWAAAMTGCGLLTHSQGDNVRAVHVHEAAVAVWRELADPARLAEALYLYGIALTYTGDDRAVPIASEFLVIARRLSDQRWLGIALWTLGHAQYLQGNPIEAEETLAEARRHVQQVGSPLATAFVDWTQGELAWDQGAEAEALPLLRQAMSRLWDLRETWSALVCLERLAEISVRDHPLVAVRLFAAAAAWRDTVGLARPIVDEARYQRAQGSIREALAGEAFVAAWTGGLSLSPEQAVAEALDTTIG